MEVEPTAPELLTWMARSLLGPALRSRGFTGSAGRWSRSNEHGDIGLVELQRGPGNTRELATFAVNVAVCPEPYVRWLDEVLGRPTRRVAHGAGVLAFRQGMYVDGRGVDADHWWEVGSRADAETAAREVLGALDSHGLAVLERYLDREELLRGAWTATPARYFRRRNDGLLPAILLSGSGPSAELDRALALLDADPRWAPTATWARTRAAQHRPDGC